MRFPAAQGREPDNGQCLNPGHNDGCHRLYKAARPGREHLPSRVLTAAETLAIRHDEARRRVAAVVPADITGSGLAIGTTDGTCRTEGQGRLLDPAERKR